MHISGKVTKRDIFRFQSCTKKRRPEKEKNAFASAGAGAAIYMAAAVFMRQYRTAVLILGAAATLFFWLYLMQKSAKESGLLGPLFVSLEEEGLEYHAGAVRTRIAYQNIRELVQTKQGDIYLYTGRLQGYILPGSLFASESERTEVLEDLKERIETAGKSHEE